MLLRDNASKILKILSRLWPAFLFLSCSIVLDRKAEPEVELTGYQKISNKDYEDHLAALGVAFLSSANVKRVSLEAQGKRYLQNLAQKIISQNKIFFESKKDVDFHIIQSETPFHFSLPGRQLFLSTALFKKYIQNENLLICVLMFELIRSEKSYYKKNLVVPKGYLSLGEMLSLMRLSAEEKMKIHKWSFRLLNKLKVDSDIYLSWLQIQNRNSIDFSMQLGDVNKISREEALFKAFVIENTRGKEDRKYRSSTKSFYRFLRSIRNS